MQKSAPLSLLLAFAASACTLIQDGRLGDPVEGCAGAGVHVEACWAMTGSRVICVDDPDELLPPPSYQDYTAWVSFEAIPMRTPTGVVLRVTEAWTDMGADACL